MDRKSSLRHSKGLSLSLSRSTQRLHKAVSFQHVGLRPALQLTSPQEGKKSLRILKSTVSPEKSYTLLSPQGSVAIKHIPSFSLAELSISYRKPERINTSSGAVKTAKAAVQLGHTLLMSPSGTVARPPLPCLPSTALTHYRNDLTDFEVSEIPSYDLVYFLGHREVKVKGDNFDNEKGDYQLTAGDHIAYRYEILGVLGKGSFGIVVRCKDHKHKEEVALKVIKSKKLFSKQGLVEVRLLQMMGEKDKEGQVPIVRLKSSFLFRKHLCLTFELLSQSLYDYLRLSRFQPQSLAFVRKIAQQLLRVLAFTKKLKILHCDLKPENILFRSESTGSIKVIDFGSACLESAKLYSYIQSRFYRAPEIVLGTGYTCAIDMWSFGCVLAELARGRPLFPAESERHLLALQMELLGVPPNVVLARSPKKAQFFDSLGQPRVVVNSRGRPAYPGSSSLQNVLQDWDCEFIDLVSRCLDWNPLTRLSPDEALRHPWVYQDRVHTGVISSNVRRVRKISLLS